jgi:transposase-like protein
MQVTEIRKRKRFSSHQKIQVLNHLKSSGKNLAEVARQFKIHPVTLHQWKRTMDSESSKESINIRELLFELETLKKDNNLLKKALGNMAMDNEILKSAVEIFQKKERQTQSKSLKK